MKYDLSNILAPCLFSPSGRAKLSEIAWFHGHENQNNALNISATLLDGDIFAKRNIQMQESLLNKNAKNNMNSGQSSPEPDLSFSLSIYTQGSQSTLMAPQVELPQSWMNFSMEKTPVRSSTDRPYSAWRPLSWLSAMGSRRSSRCGQHR